MIPLSPSLSSHLTAIYNIYSQINWFYIDNQIESNELELFKWDRHRAEIIDFYYY